MTRCPNCGSTSQPKVVATEYTEDGWTIEVVRTYKCGCGQMFTGTSYHTCQECYEIVEKIEKQGLTSLFKVIRITYNHSFLKKVLTF